jgi:hypothetical protein
MAAAAKRRGENRETGERKQTDDNSMGRDGGMIQAIQPEERPVKQHNPRSRWRASLESFSGTGFW